MLRCSKCGEIFAEDEALVKTYTDYVPYGEQFVSVEYEEMLCPECGSEKIDKIEESETDYGYYENGRKPELSRIVGY